MVAFLEYAANVALRPQRHVAMTRNTAMPIDKGTNPPSRNLSELARRKDPLIVVRVPHRRPVAIVPQPQHSRETGNIANEVSEFLLDPGTGLEQVYAIVKQATEP